MTDFTKISIIVPIYKIERYLRQCIESILAQTFTDFELLLIDDGSPDECPTICDEYTKKDTRIRVFHKPNGGLTSARNYGLYNAKGEWIMHIDGDDWIEPHTLKNYIMQQLRIMPILRYVVCVLLMKKVVLL